MIDDAMLYDAELLREAAYPHNLALLRELRAAGVKVGLATMSYRVQVERVLAILDVGDSFDVIATRDGVARGKPDPEIYLLAARRLGVEASECMVLEDSLAGVQAGLAAGMNVIAVTTALTRPAFHDSAMRERLWVVYDPATLPEVVRWCVLRHQEAAHGGAEWSLPLARSTFLGTARRRSTTTGGAGGLPAPQPSSPPRAGAGSHRRASSPWPRPCPPEPNTPRVSP